MGRFGFGWNVPIGVVTSIGVVPKSFLSVTDFVKDGSFKAEDSGAGYIYYINETEGLTIETHKGGVTGFTYTPLKTEDSRRCPRIQECCVDFFRYDSYGKLSPEDERARLDLFAVELKGAPHRQGVILAYGGRRGRRGEAMRSAERAKNYLVKAHGIEPSRLLAADGGFREELTVELSIRYIGSDVAGRVYAVPTIDPSEVQFLKGGRAKKPNRRRFR